MVDIPALRKVVDYALALPTWDDTAAHQKGADVWNQSDWLRVDEHGIFGRVDEHGIFGGEGYYHASNCIITEQGLVTETGKKCGTAGCIAGWAALLLAPNGTKVDGEWLTLPDGRESRIEYWAQERLELSTFYADELFEGSNTHEDVMRIVADIITEVEAAEQDASRHCQAEL